VRLIQTTGNSEIVLLLVANCNWNQSDTSLSWRYTNIISSDLCEAYNRTGDCQRCI